MAAVVYYTMKESSESVFLGRSVRKKDYPFFLQLKDPSM